MDGNRTYDEILSEISSTIARSSDRFDELADSVARSLSVLLNGRNPARLTHEESSVARSFEMLFAEAMHVNAWLMHTQNDHAGARNALRIARRVQDIILSATDAR